MVSTQNGAVERRGRLVSARSSAGAAVGSGGAKTPPRASEGTLRGGADATGPGTVAAEAAAPVVHWAPHPGKQTLALALSGVDELLYGGARGGGKTDAGMAWLVRPPHFAHKLYRALVLRRNYEDLVDWLDRARTMYAPLGGRVIQSRPARIEFPWGPVIRCGHLKDDQAFSKYQGHEYQRLVLEEAGIVPREDQYMMVLGSVRSTVPGLSSEVFLTANPGGVGHAWLKARFGCGAADARESCRAYRGRDGRVRMYIPATVQDNPTLLREDPGYVQWLEGLPEPLRSAWLLGDWDIYAGQAFEWSAQNIIDPCPVPPAARLLMTFDWGSGKPFSVGWWWVTADDLLVRIGEWYGCVPGRPDMGLRMADHEIAMGILERERALGIAGRVSRRLADPTVFNQRPDYKGGGQAESLAAVFQRCGVSLGPGDPSRRVKFRQFGARIKTRSLLVFSSCRDFIRTVPDLPLDENSYEDVDTDAEDHVYDEACHAVQAVPLPDWVLRGSSLAGRGGPADWAAAQAQAPRGGSLAPMSLSELLAERTVERSAVDDARMRAALMR